MQDNTSLVRRMFDAINNHDLNGILACVDRNVEWVSGEQTLRGVDEFKQMVQGWLTAFPDCRLEIKNLVCSGEWCTSEFVATGTNSGPFVLPTGQLSPTGRRVELSFCEVYKCSNDRISMGHTYFDMYSLLRQLGQLPMTKQAGS